MFGPSRGQIAQRWRDNGAVVRALPSSSSLLILLSLDNDDDPASILSSPLQSPSTPPAAAPKLQWRRAHRPQPQRQVDGKDVQCCDRRKVGPVHPPRRCRCRMIIHPPL
jgi:hypothetical protein